MATPSRPLYFDLAPDEIHLFMQEVDEHIQTLEESLIRLELEPDNKPLFDATLRAAHTIKGSAGMIGHRRMADLTHHMESVLDQLRVKQLNLSQSVTDALLDALDVLRELRGEILTLETAAVDIDLHVERLQSLTRAPASPPNPATESASEKSVSKKTSAKSTGAKKESASEPVSVVCAISSNSIATAARAFQIVQTLETFGEVVDLEPSMAVIESAAPVQRLTASVITSKSQSELSEALQSIPDIERVRIGGEWVEAADSQGGSQQKQTGGQAAVQTVDQTVRISVERLDALMNLAGELVTDRNRLFQMQRKLASAHPGGEGIEELGNTAVRLSRITDQLQEEVMQVRMLPVGSVFQKFPRVVRDLARKFGKQVRLVIHGEETELDRSVLEKIGDPLTHIIRNSVDHGLELPEEREKNGKPKLGTVLLEARHEAGRIVIAVEDDGGGLSTSRIRQAAVRKGLITEAEAEVLSNEEAVELIFHSGLSTAKKVTDVSGRGVGMDIVRTNIERLSGSISVDTQPGLGSRFEISLPLTLAIFPALLVKIESVVCALPLSDVVEALQLDPTEIKLISGRPVFNLRDHVIPIVDLSELFNWPALSGNGNARVVVVRWGKQEMGLKVGTLIGEENIVIKPLGKVIGNSNGSISGTAIMGDGSVALVLDVPGLIRLTSLAIAT